MGSHRLVDQHFHAAHHHGPGLFGQTEQLCFPGIVHSVKHGAAAGHHFLGHRAHPCMGEHPHAGGIEGQLIPALLLFQLGIGDSPGCKMVVAQIGGILGKIFHQGLGFGQAPLTAGNGQLGTGPLLHRLKGDGPGGAAIAQQQQLPGKGHPMVFQGFAAARTIGGVAGQFAVLYLDGIHRAKPPGFFLHLIQKGQDGAFVGQGDVEAVQLAQGR